MTGPTAQFDRLPQDFDTWNGRCASYVTECHLSVAVHTEDPISLKYTENHAENTLEEAKSFYSVADLLLILPASLILLTPVVGSLTFFELFPESVRQKRPTQVSDIGFISYQTSLVN